MKRTMNSAPQTEAANLSVYRAPQVVAHYAGQDYLTPCERLLFDTYLKPGTALLDLGVGGGRTAGYLSSIASRYVGVDYSEEMIAACRRRYPDLSFEVADAADLSRYADGLFDAVVFSFNGIDSLAPDAKRHHCLRECHRVLKPGGVFIFSSHNPRKLIVGWECDWNHLGVLAGRIARGRKGLAALALAGLVCARVGLVPLRTAARMIQRIPTRAFWRGEGYLFDSTHGGSTIHCATPPRVIAELADCQFQLVRELPDDYPRTTGKWTTGWYYYVFSRA